ncbi:hypothetical protein A0U90_06320 [Kozakia baliensis]|nr:hypothetical protein A0U90_06320 [Kozakia baliensis]
MSAREGKRMFGRFLLIWSFLGLMFLSAVPSFAAPSDGTSAQTAKPAPGAAAPGATPSEGIGWNSISANVNRQLASIQTTLKRIFNQLNRTDVPIGTDALVHMGQQAEGALNNAQSLQTQIASYQSIYESYLDVIGAKPVEGESPNIAAQRKRLQTGLQDIKSARTQSKLYELQAKQLQADIQRRNVRMHQALLSEQLESPLTPGFWHNLIGDYPDDRQVFARPSDDGYTGPLYRWPYFLIALGGTLAVLVLAGRPSLSLLRRVQVSIMRRFGHRQEADTSSISFLPVALNGFVCAVMSVIVWELLAHILGFASDEGNAFISGLAGALPICGFIIGAGLPILSHATAADGLTPDAPRALRGADWSLALIVLFQNILLLLSKENIFGLTSQRFLEGIYAIVVSTIFAMVCRRLSHDSEAQHIRLAPPVRGVSFLVMIVAWGAVALGYFSFAFTMVSWFVSLGVGLAILGLLALCLRELTTRLLAPGTLLAARLAPLGVGSNRVAQLGVLISGAGNLILMVVLVAIAMSDGNFDIATIADRLRTLFVGQSINGVHFSLGTVVTCIFILIAAYYGIRQVRLWLEHKLFPTTRLDIGAQSSILNVITYVAWIAIFLLTLSEAGLTMKNLTWVVSALSVGIGFGLQSIVQNFVSGIILIAERLIRVGDMVQIGGTTGDVKRISVRSTEIGLGDGSTMIVPNSQFITSPVRNATLSGALSAVSVSVTISPRADAMSAQQLLMKMMEERSDILKSPGPSVAISAITDTGVTLALSAKVPSARDVGGVTNAMMEDAYRALREADIPLGKPA